MPVKLADRAPTQGAEVEVQAQVRIPGRRYGFKMAAPAPVKGVSIEQPRVLPEPEEGAEPQTEPAATSPASGNPRLAPATRVIPTPPQPIRNPQPSEPGESPQTGEVPAAEPAPAPPRAAPPRPAPRPAPPRRPS